MLVTQSTFSHETVEKLSTPDDLLSCGKGDLFADLCMTRKGGSEMTMGSCDTTILPLTSREEWEQKAAAFRELYLLTLGRSPDEQFESSPEITEECRMDISGKYICCMNVKMFLQM